MAGLSGEVLAKGKAFGELVVQSLMQPYGRCEQNKVAGFAIVAFQRFRE